MSHSKVLQSFWQVALLAGLFVFAPAYAQKQLTVEAIYGGRELSGSLPSAVQWTPDGKAFTYFQRSEDGKLNVWRYDLASKQKS
ncbi:hypothetical protein FBQ85_19770, partial [Cytophagia bacterium CHB2]|nr:hypothetical protein [Cytophagia bacterium CHB2]